MKWFEIRMVVAVLFGLLMLSGLNSPPAYADFVFGAPVVVDWAIPIFESSKSWDGWQCFSYDGLEMYITAYNFPGMEGYGSFDLWVVRRASVEDEWGPPENLGPEINSPMEDSLPSISADGLTLYFCSPRPGGHGSFDLYMTTRPTRDDPWGPAVNLGPPINSSSSEGDPWISPNGLELYFSSDRPGGSGGTDLHVSRRLTTSDPWGEPVNLGPGVNSPVHDQWPSLSPDGLLLLFNDHPHTGPRPGGYGGLDIWMTRRTSLSDPWQDAVNAGPQVNTPRPETLPRISPDGSTLYFWRGGRGLMAAPIVAIVDFNGDGVVDLVDLLMLIENWGTDDPFYDIGPYAWGDGVVDASDLEVFMRYWGQDVGDFEEPAELIAHWRLDETEGVIAYDSVGTYDALVLGDPVWRPEDGKLGGAIELDGIADVLETDFILDPKETSFSVFAWVKGGAPGQSILSQIEGTCWLQTDHSTGNLMTSLNPISAVGGRPLRSEVAITDGEWHHVGLTWNVDLQTRILYAGNAAVARDIGTDLRVAKTHGGLYIGAPVRLHFPGYWCGLIDDVQLYTGVVKP